MGFQIEKVTHRLVLAGALSLGLVSAAAGNELLQATNPAGAMYALRLGADQWIGGSTAGSVELPAGAGLYDLEPTDAGWVAGGQVPYAEGTDLLLLEEKSGEVDLMPLPEKGRGRLRGQTVVLVHEGSLIGIAWVEGDRERDLEIWAAAWDGADWAERESVSPRGPGSQLALAGTVLEDGSWLLAWSAVDGQDDETVWSLRRDGRWSSPTRVHEDNDVPDVTPALVTVEGGALIAWNWYDGWNYTLRTARFDGAEWELFEPFDDDGLYPSFLEADGGARLIYQTVTPETWIVLELDAAGRRGRSAVAPIFTYDRPRVVPDGEDGVVFEWPAASEEEGLSTGRTIESAWEVRP